MRCESFLSLTSVKLRWYYYQYREEHSIDKSALTFYSPVFFVQLMNSAHIWNEMDKGNLRWKAIRQKAAEVILLRQTEIGDSPDVNGSRLHRLQM
jgi:hypothetical protein